MLYGFCPNQSAKQQVHVNCNCQVKGSMEMFRCIKCPYLAIVNASKMVDLKFLQFRSAIVILNHFMFLFFFDFSK